MVRRSTLDRGPQPDVHGAGPAAYASQPGRGSETLDALPAPRRGAGGRWAVWTFRIILWAVLIIIGARGIIAIALNQKTPATSPGAPASSAGPSTRFPSALAQAYALQFASVYLNFSQATATVRAQRLAAFLPPGADSQLGWNRAGSMTLDSAQAAGVQVRDSQHAVVLVLAEVNGKLMELGVPVYAAGGGLVVTGQPAWLPAPAKAAPAAPAAGQSDPAATAALQAQLPAFFTAYASGSATTLARFLAPGASVTPLGGAVTFSSISGLYVPTGGDARPIIVSVTWQIPGQAGTAAAQLQMTYQMTVVSQNSSWYVKSIRASTDPVPQS